VLLVEADPLGALRLQRLLGDVGYCTVGPASCAEEAMRLIECCRRPLSAALLNSELADAPTIADRLTARSIPIVWLVQTADAALPAAHANAPVLHRPFDRRGVLDAIDRASRPQHTIYVTPPPQAVWPRVFPQL
jgi:hypothetical protein